MSQKLLFVLIVAFAVLSAALSIPMLNLINANANMTFGTFWTFMAWFASICMTFIFIFLWIDNSRYTRLKETIRRLGAIPQATAEYIIVSVLLVIASFVLIILEVLALLGVRMPFYTESPIVIAGALGMFLLGLLLYWFYKNNLAEAKKLSIYSEAKYKKLFRISFWLYVILIAFIILLFVAVVSIRFGNFM